MRTSLLVRRGDDKKKKEALHTKRETTSVAGAGTSTVDGIRAVAVAVADSVAGTGTVAVAVAGAGAGAVAVDGVSESGEVAPEAAKVQKTEALSHHKQASPSSPRGLPRQPQHLTLSINQTKTPQMVNQG